MINLNLKNLKQMLLNFKILKYLDFIILSIVFISIIVDLLSIFKGLVSSIVNLISGIELNFVHMVNGSETVASGSGNTTTTVTIHTNTSLKDTIRSTFIYGIGTFRLISIHHGGPGSRFFTTVSTIGMDFVATAISRILQDPNYLPNQVVGAKEIFTGARERVENGVLSKIVDLKGSEADKVLDAIIEVKNNKKFVSSGDGNGLDDLGATIINKILDNIKDIIEPIPVDYSIELLSNQIYSLTLMLFIMALLLSVLIFSFLFNILIILNKEKILNFFNNKYIHWYVNLQLKFITYEIILIGGFILYSLYFFIKGLHFLVTHPLILPSF